MNNLKAIIEGMLFVCGDEGASLKDIAAALEISEQIAENVLNEMIEEYNNNENRGIMITVLAGKYKFLSKPECHQFCQNLLQSSDTHYFSQAALETLAIIAYKQPVTRVEIEEIRGVSCDLMIKKLLAKNLIKEVDRLETIGRPFTYGVTDYFLDTFKLKSIDELPPIEDIAQLNRMAEGE